MRALILTGSPASLTSPLRVVGQQIVAGPDWPDAQTRDGLWISLRTPVGHYDLADLLSKIPADQWPDEIVCLADQTGRSQPRNLGAFAGTKTLLLPACANDATDLPAVLSSIGCEPFDCICPLSAPLRIAS
jgi:hypothetical protein